MQFYAANKLRALLCSGLRTAFPYCERLAIRNAHSAVGAAAQRMFIRCTIVHTIVTYAVGSQVTSETILHGRHALAPNVY